MNTYQPVRPEDHTVRNIFIGIVLAAVAIGGGMWVIDEIQTAAFISDCESQGGVPKVWTITGQKFCDYTP